MDLSHLYAFTGHKMRNRKPQWTHKETQYLIKEYDKRKIVLRPRKGQLVTAGSKHKAWVEIAQCVNLTNPHVHRTVAEVQKKWQNLCLRTTKAKANVTIDTNNSEKGKKRLNLYLLRSIKKSTCHV